MSTERRRSARSALRHVRLWPVLALMAALGAAGSLLATGIAAAASAAGAPGFTGLAESAIAVGSIIGGLWWGRRAVRRSWRSAATVLLLLWAAFSALIAAITLGPAMLAPLVAVGYVGAPLWIVAYLAADEAVPESVRTEANTWVTTASNLGTTAGTAGAGVVSAFAIRLPLVAAAGVAAIAGAACLIANVARCQRSV